MNLVVIMVAVIVVIGITFMFYRDITYKAPPKPTKGKVIFKSHIDPDDLPGVTEEWIVVIEDENGIENALHLYNMDANSWNKIKVGDTYGS